MPFRGALQVFAKDTFSISCGSRPCAPRAAASARGSDTLSLLLRNLTQESAFAQLVLPAV